MTLSELIMAHTEMGLGPHDEVLLGSFDADDKVELHKIIAIQHGYLIIDNVSHLPKELNHDPV